MNIQILEYTTSDKPDVLEMMAVFNAIDGYSFDRTVTDSNLDEFTTNPSLGRLYLIKDGRKNIGYIALTFGYSFEYQGRDAFIDELFIEERYRNRGIGKKALEFLASKCRSLQVNAIHLEVEMHNARAKELYLKHGFKSNERMLLTKRFGPCNMD